MIIDVTDQKISIFLLTIQKHQNANVILHQLQGHLIIQFPIFLIFLGDEGVEFPDAHMRCIEGPSIIKVLTDGKVGFIGFRIYVS